MGDFLYIFASMITWLWYECFHFSHRIIFYLFSYLFFILGIRVAVVLANPMIRAGKELFHETQSKVRMPKTPFWIVPTVDFNFLCSTERSSHLFPRFHSYDLSNIPFPHSSALFLPSIEWIIIPAPSPSKHTHTLSRLLQFLALDSPTWLTLRSLSDQQSLWLTRYELQKNIK